MNSRKTLWWMLFVLVLGTMAAAQVSSHIAIESGNGGSVFAPTNPNGFFKHRAVRLD
jgi:hypothetical protein